MSAENSLTSLFEQLQGKQLAPVDVSLINFGYSQSDENIDLIQKHSITLKASELLTLNDIEIYSLSKRVRDIFNITASRLKTKIDRKDLDQFKDDESNAILHEVYHLRKIKQLRPELIENSEMHILGVIHHGILKSAMNVTNYFPSVPYTVVEQSEILLAPNYPSDADYQNLYQYILRNYLGKDIQSEQTQRMLEMVKVKPKNSGREKLISFLNTYISSNN